MTKILERRQLHADNLETQHTADDGRQTQIHTAMPGSIIDFDAATMTATVQLAIQGVQTKLDGTRQNITIAPLQHVPVFFTGAGGHTLTFPVAAGDECLVVFSERNIDAWYQHGGVQPPMDWRMHDINDGIALVGSRSQPNVLGSGGSGSNSGGSSAPQTSTKTVQLRSNDGKTLVDLNGADNAITLYANGAGEAVVFVDGKNQDITLQTQNTVTINAPTVTINGELHVTGEIWAKFGAGQVSVSQHVHQGANAGRPPQVGTATMADTEPSIEQRLELIEALLWLLIERVPL